jgi:glycosyltransferase involved in cell wall biosynthesis
MNALRAVANRRWRTRRNESLLRIGFLGRLSPEKGTRELLEVSTILYESGIGATVAIAGDGPDHEWLATGSRAMREAGFMTNHGVVQDVADFLGKVDVLVMPSHNEGLPYALLEAMAAGCAVVAFGVGGIPEVISDPSLGVLVRPGDTDGLASAIRRLCEAPTVVASIGKAASEHVREHYALGMRLPLISQAYGMEMGPPPATSGRHAVHGYE